MSSRYTEIKDPQSGLGWFSTLFKADKSGNAPATEESGLLRKDSLLQAACKKFTNNSDAIIELLNHPVLLSHYKSHPNNKSLENDLSFLAMTLCKKNFEQIDYVSIFACDFFLQQKDNLDFNVLFYRALRTYSEDIAGWFINAINLEGKLSDAFFGRFKSLAPLPDIWNDSSITSTL